MHRYTEHYRGYWIEAALEESWLVRVRPTIAELPSLPVSALLLPRTFTPSHVFNEAYARIDVVLRIPQCIQEVVSNKTSTG
jgi:hypothetical protein